MQVAALRHILTVPTMIAIAVLVLVLSSADTSEASFSTPEFSPTYGGALCNPLPATFIVPAAQGSAGCVGTKTPSTVTDVGQILNVPVGHINFSPGLFVTASRGLTFKTEAGLGALGTLVGGLRSTTTLGLTNAVCGSGPTIFPEFVFWNATTDNTGSVFAVQPEGTPDRFSTLAADAVDDDGDTFAQTDDDAFPQIADPMANIVIGYPDFNNTLFNGAKPIARYAALSRVPAGDDWIALQVFIFNPKTLRDAFLTSAGDRTAPYARLIGTGTPSSGLGTVVITVLQDPSATGISVSIINDFCTPLGVLAGFLGVATTPAAGGNHFSGTLVQSQRFIATASETDGLENSFDTCPFDTNVENQLFPSFDAGPDGDNFDSACDPTPGVNTGANDHDGDGYTNAQDGCPANDQWDTVLGLPAPVDSESTGTAVAAAPDGGPQGDSIWDDCDPDDVRADGDFFMLHEVNSFCIEAGGFVDANNDGWCDSTTNFSGVFVEQIPEAGDPDLDLISSNDEVLIGTDPLNDCSLINGHDAWPADFDMNRKIDVVDVFKVLPPIFGTVAGGVGYSPRADLAPNGKIDVVDVFKVLPPIFGQTCTP